MPAQFHVPHFEARLEVHFADQYVASVVFEVNLPLEDSERVDLACFAMFALQQLVRVGGETAMSTAALLSQLGAPELQEQVLRPGSALDVRILNFAGPGRYQFFATMQNGPSTTKPNMWPIKAKGFGWFGAGVNYYAPNSVLVLANYLHNRRDAADFRGRLVQTAANCGKMYAEGRVGNMSQFDAAFAAWTSTYSAELRATGGDGPM
jgi:hypothetical protein